MYKVLPGNGPDTTERTAVLDLFLPFVAEKIETIFATREDDQQTLLMVKKELFDATEVRSLASSVWFLWRAAWLH